MTTSKKRLLLAVTLMALAPLAATAPPARVAIGCARPCISQPDASRALDTDNFAQTWDERQLLYANVARTCNRGVECVLLVGRERSNRTRLAATC